MTLKEIQLMSNYELVIKFMGLCHIRGERQVLNKIIDNDLNENIEIMINEILTRISNTGEILDTYLI